MFQVSSFSVATVPVQSIRGARWLSRLGALALLAASSPTEAAPAARERFASSVAGSEWWRLDDLDFQGLGRWAGRADVERLDAQAVARLSGALVLADRLRVSLALPLSLVPEAEAGPGSLRLGVDVRGLGDAGDRLTVAGGARLWTPISAATWRQGGVAGDLHAAAAGRVSVLAYAAELGVHHRTGPMTLALHRGTELQGGLAMALRLGPVFALGPELRAARPLGSARLDGSPVELLLGAHVGTCCGLRVSGGVGWGLTSATGNPELRLLLAVAYRRPDRR
jgi:hypothetical protein